MCPPQFVQSSLGWVFPFRVFANPFSAVKNNYHNPLGLVLIIAQDKFLNENCWVKKS